MESLVLYISWMIQDIARGREKAARRLAIEKNRIYANGWSTHSFHIVETAIIDPLSSPELQYIKRDSRAGEFKMPLNLLNEIGVTFYHPSADPPNRPMPTDFGRQCLVRSENLPQSERCLASTCGPRRQDKQSVQTVSHSGRRTSLAWLLDFC